MKYRILAYISICFATSILPMADTTNNVHNTQYASIHDAIAANDYAAVDTMANRNTVNVQDREGNTPLHIAIKNGYITIARRLLQEPHIDLNSINANYKRPLEIAIATNNIHLMQLLLETDTIEKDLPPERNGYSPLIYAITCGNNNAVDTLLRYGAYVNGIQRTMPSPLHVAVREQNSSSDIVETLLSYGANPNKQNLISYQTPLHYTICRILEFRNVEQITAEMYDVILLLLRHGAEINARARYNVTPLHLATCTYKFLYHERPEDKEEQAILAKIIVLLLQSGAAVNAKDSNNVTPIAHALLVQLNDDTLPIVETLLQYGALLDDEVYAIADIMPGSAWDKAFNQTLNNLQDPAHIASHATPDIMRYTKLAIGQGYTQTAANLASQLANTTERKHIWLHAYIMNYLHPDMEAPQRVIEYFTQYYSHEKLYDILSAIADATQRKALSPYILLDIIQQVGTDGKAKNTLATICDEDGNTLLHHIAHKQEYTQSVPQIFQMSSYNNKDHANNSDKTIYNIAEEQQNTRLLRMLELQTTIAALSKKHYELPFLVISWKVKNDNNMPDVVNNYHYQRKKTPLTQREAWHIVDALYQSFPQEFHR